MRVHKVKNIPLNDSICNSKRVTTCAHFMPTFV